MRRPLPTSRRARRPSSASTPRSRRPSGARRPKRWPRRCVALDRAAPAADIRFVPTEYHFRGAARARDARDELGLGQDGPLEDILTAVEELGGAHVVVLDLPEDVAGAYITRP